MIGVLLETVIPAMVHMVLRMFISLLFMKYFLIMPMLLFFRFGVECWSCVCCFYKTWQYGESDFSSKCKKCLTSLWLCSFNISCILKGHSVLNCIGIFGPDRIVLNCSGWVKILGIDYFYSVVALTCRVFLFSFSCWAFANERRTSPWSSKEQVWLFNFPSIDDLVLFPLLLHQ